MLLSSVSRCTMKGTVCGHVPSLNSLTSASEITGHHALTAYVACDCSLPRTLRNSPRFRQFRARGQDVRGYRVSRDGRSGLHVEADPASLAPCEGECTILGGQRQVVSAVARASRRSLWGRLYLVTSFSRRKRRWHYQLYTCCTGLLHHTVAVRMRTSPDKCRLYTPLTSSGDNGRRLCILAS
jgi:hypothetical protein